MDDIEFKKKYMKYKLKYLKLKMLGGMSSGNDETTLATSTRPPETSLYTSNVYPFGYFIYRNTSSNSY